MMVYRDYKDTMSFSSEDIAFGLAPILNSAGRLEDASLSVEFVTAVSLQDARVALEKLVTLNERRKEIERELTEEVSSFVNDSDKVIVVSSVGWHEGVVGIVASKIKDKYNKPAIILNEKDGICKGSGRSIDGCDLFRLIDSNNELLDKYGGHSAAVGLSMEVNNLAKFRELLNENYLEFYTETENSDSRVVGELSFKEIDIELINIMEQFEPYGEANSRPRFMTSSVNILAVQAMGKDKNHLRFTLEHDEAIHQAVEFNTYEVYDIGDSIDIVYKVSVNHFRGESSIQLMVENISRIS